MIMLCILDDAPKIYLSLISETLLQGVFRLPGSNSKPQQPLYIDDFVRKNPNIWQLNLDLLYLAGDLLTEARLDSLRSSKC